MWTLISKLHCVLGWWRCVTQCPTVACIDRWCLHWHQYVFNATPTWPNRANTFNYSISLFKIARLPFSFETFLRSWSRHQVLDRTEISLSSIFSYYSKDMAALLHHTALKVQCAGLSAISRWFCRLSWLLWATAETWKISQSDKYSFWRNEKGTSEF